MYFRRYDLSGKDSVDATGFAYAKMRKPMTNADRIRTMSDEELANFICGIYTLKEDAYGDYDYRLVVQGNEFRDDDGLLDWLKATVEDGTDGN